MSAKDEYVELIFRNICFFKCSGRSRSRLLLKGKPAVDIMRSQTLEAGKINLLSMYRAAVLVDHNLCFFSRCAENTSLWGSGLCSRGDVRSREASALLLAVKPAVQFYFNFTSARSKAGCSTIFEVGDSPECIEGYFSITASNKTRTFAKVVHVSWNRTVTESKSPKVTSRASRVVLSAFLGTSIEISSIPSFGMNFLSCWYLISIWYVELHLVTLFRDMKRRSLANVTSELTSPIPFAPRTLFTFIPQIPRTPPDWTCDYQNPKIHSRWVLLEHCWWRHCPQPMRGQCWDLFNILIGRNQEVSYLGPHQGQFRFLTRKGQEGLQR